MVADVFLASPTCVIPPSNLHGGLEVQKRTSFEDHYETLFCSYTYRIYPAIRRGFCPSRMTSNN